MVHGSEQIQSFINMVCIVEYFGIKMRKILKINKNFLKNKGEWYMVMKKQEENVK